MQELLLNAVITPVNVVNPIDRSLSFCDQASQHQTGRCPQVRGHYLRTPQLTHTVHYRSVATQFDVRTHALQFLHVHKTVLENTLGDGSRPFGDAIQKDELGLHIGRKTRVWGSLQRHCPGSATRHIQR